MSEEKLSPSSIYPSIDYFYNEFYLLGIFLSALGKAVNRDLVTQSITMIIIAMKEMGYEDRIP